MEQLKKWSGRGLVVVAVLAMGAALTRTLVAGASDAPQAKDFKAAQRIAASRDGKADFRAPLRAAGAIAGQGIIEPRDREVKVGAPVGGVIAHLFVKEGDRVRAGQPLVELQDDVEKTAVEVALAQLEKAKAGQRLEEQRALAADAASAEAKARLSAISAQRTRALMEKGAATVDDDDKASYQARIDQAASEGFEARAVQARSGWRLDVAVSQAQLDQARAQLDRLTIRSPLDGTVLQLVVREGEYYSVASSQLATVGDLTKIRARLDVDERDIASVRLGQRGYVTAEAFGARRFPGTVVDIARRMGRKNQRTDEPTERIDTKIREVVLELDDGHELVQGIRVAGYLEAAENVALK